MRITRIDERSVAISRYSDPAILTGTLTTSVVAISTDVAINGKPIVGFGFGSVGRFSQGGLMRERFIPRILSAEPRSLLNVECNNLDPFKVWETMMKGEKPGGHGERCVAVGTLDMAVWDAAAKIAGLPLAHYLALTIGTPNGAMNSVPAYAGGGYLYPDDDIGRLSSEIRRLTDMGYERVKIKVGGSAIAADLGRIEAVLERLPRGGWLAIDAMNAYDASTAASAAEAFGSLGLRWFEDICDPHDFETQRRAAQAFGGPIAVGEALFSAAEAALLDNYGGLHRDRDILVFDPAHCYGIPGFLQIVHTLEGAGWPRTAFWPHGGHLYAHHVVAALRLGGAEVNPLAFSPFGGLSDSARPANGLVTLPPMPGVGFESRKDLAALFAQLAWDR